MSRYQTLLGLIEQNFGPSVQLELSSPTAHQKITELSEFLSLAGNELIVAGASDQIVLNFLRLLPAYKGSLIVLSREPVSLSLTLHYSLQGLRFTANIEPIDNISIKSALSTIISKEPISFPSFSIGKREHEAQTSTAHNLESTLNLFEILEAHDPQNTYKKSQYLAHISNTPPLDWIKNSSVDYSQLFNWLSRYPKRFLSDFLLLAISSRNESLVDFTCRSLFELGAVNPHKICDSLKSLSPQYSPRQDAISKRVWSWLVRNLNTPNCPSLVSSLDSKYDLKSDLPTTSQEDRANYFFQKAVFELDRGSAGNALQYISAYKRNDSLAKGIYTSFAWQFFEPQWKFAPILEWREKDEELCSQSTQYYCNALAACGNEDKALEILGEGVTSNVLAEIALSSRKTGQHEAALKLFRLAQSKEPKNPRYIRELSTSLFVSQKPIDDELFSTLKPKLVYDAIWNAYSSHWKHPSKAAEPNHEDMYSRVLSTDPSGAEFEYYRVLITATIYLGSIEQAASLLDKACAKLPNRKEQLSVLFLVTLALCGHSNHIQSHLDLLMKLSTWSTSVPDQFTLAMLSALSGVHENSYELLQRAHRSSPDFFKPRNMASYCALTLYLITCEQLGHFGIAQELNAFCKEHSVIYEFYRERFPPPDQEESTSLKELPFELYIS
ncbi:hypothetical protein [Pelagicoccus sp. SDUM812005]|uniref:tetratricopeptide repeat protein n=1 Tax=Pelagicoccus sp. SDUM812005 TaxID=3041257 RepID=UPI0028117FAA|nr:hypothetical protein [Pelagicoccus sp. SDUM812005]